MNEFEAKVDEPQTASPEVGHRESSQPYQQLLSSASRFLNDLECIRELFEEVAPSLKKKDDARSEKLERLFGSAEVRTEGDRKVITINVKNHQSLIDDIRKFGRADFTFRNQTIVGMLSRFEEFLSELLRAALRATPQRFLESEKTLTYRELLTLNQESSVTDLIIGREIDDIMRQSPEEQLRTLDKRLKIGIMEEFKPLPAFLELAERRNLFVHSGARITKQYLEKCQQNNCGLEPNTKLGEILSVSDSYFIQCFDTLYLLAVHVSQAAFRRLFPERLANADRALNENMGYQLLLRKQFSLAKQVFEFALAIPTKLVSADERRKVFLINLCICLHSLGDQAEVRKKLSDVDWSSLNPKFVLARSVLLGEFEAAGTMMETFSRDFPIDEADYREWPLFEEFRKTPQFEKAFLKLFGHGFEPQATIERGILESAVPNKTASDPGAAVPEGRLVESE